VTPGTFAESSDQTAQDLLGTRVRVEEAGKVIRIGYVEAATHSGALFWIGAAGCEPRRLYGSALGQSIFPMPEAEGAD
jgi:hypothetical protein